MKNNIVYINNIVYNIINNIVLFNLHDLPSKQIVNKRESFNTSQINARNKKENIQDERNLKERY